MYNYDRASLASHMWKQNYAALPTRAHQTRLTALRGMDLSPCSLLSMPLLAGVTWFDRGRSCWPYLCSLALSFPEAGCTMVAACLDGALSRLPHLTDIALQYLSDVVECPAVALEAVRVIVSPTRQPRASQAIVFPNRPAVATTAMIQAVSQAWPFSADAITLPFHKLVSLHLGVILQQDGSWSSVIRWFHGSCHSLHFLTLSPLLRSLPTEALLILKPFTALRGIGTAPEPDVWSSTGPVLPCYTFNQKTEALYNHYQ